MSDRSDRIGQLSADEPDGVAEPSRGGVPGRWVGAAREWLHGRGRAQRWGAAGVFLAVLLTVGGWWLLGGDTGTPAWFGGSGGSSADAGASSDGQTGLGSRSGGGSGGERDQAGSAVSAPPRVLPFAEQPGKPEAPRASPTAPNELPEGNEGCDYAYGDRTVCVPWQFPAGVTDGCDWLKERGYQPVKVNGRDRHGLDRNGDGTACGPGD